jgi:hypothetical protein
MGAAKKDPSFGLTDKHMILQLLQTMQQLLLQTGRFGSTGQDEGVQNCSSKN